MRPRASWGLIVLAACGGSSPSAANRGAGSACQAGDADACSLLGMSMYLEARATGSSLEPAIEPFVKACDRGDWHGCGMAAYVKKAVDQNPRPVAARAFPMAMTACRGGSAGACVYVGDWAAKAADKVTAADHYRMGCELDVEAVGVHALDEYACGKAIELGVRRDDLAAKIGPERPHPEFRRVSGEKDIQPPMDEARGICRMRLTQVTAQLMLCLSPSGVPSKILFTQFSGARAWDRTIFETMRTWRYTPFIGKSGKPEPVCTGITFQYQPAC
jgi:hypothetical protein